MNPDTPVRDMRAIARALAYTRVNACRRRGLICTACLRIRFSPMHGVARLLGIRPGDR